MEITLNLPDDAAELLNKITARYNVSASEIIRKSILARYRYETYDKQPFISLFLSKAQSDKLGVIRSHYGTSIFKFFKVAIEEEFEYIMSGEDIPE